MNLEKLKIKFKNYNIIEKNYSQAAQDLFVLSCLDGKKDGIFLDLGCNHPININNTFLLEQKFNWNGLSLDIEEKHTSLYKNMRNTGALCQDCVTFNFNYVIDTLKTKHIDYLSLDLEPASVTLNCLKNIPFNDVEFSIITYEHDSYRFGDYYKIESRKILENFGYKRISSDVSNEGNEYEDWYLNPKFIDYESLLFLESQSKDWKDVIFNS